MIMMKCSDEKKGTMEGEPMKDNSGTRVQGPSSCVRIVSGAIDNGVVAGTDIFKCT